MPEAKTARMTIRLDGRTGAELAELVKYFSEHVGGSSPSQVVRTAVRELYREYAPRIEAQEGM